MIVKRLHMFSLLSSKRLDDDHFAREAALFSFFTVDQDCHTYSTIESTICLL